MGPTLELTTAAADARLLLVAAETDWTRPVPTCPDWHAAELVRHTGGIFAWMASIATTREQVSRRDPGPPPEDPTDLPLWFLANLERTLDVFRAADPQSPIWTFSSRGDQRVSWWYRRLAVEVAIHRWDADHAAGRPAVPLNGEIAAAGIEEFLVEFLPGLLNRLVSDSLAGTVHLHATDGPSEWLIDLDTGSATPGHGKADTAIKGTRSELLLWLTNRLPTHQVDVLGVQATAEAWTQLQR